MVDVFKLTIPQLTGDEERTAYVYSPNGIDEPCPVLYMFDGQNLFFDSTASFGKSWGLLKYLEETKLPLIVASVACNTHPESYHLGGRFSEYSPFSFHDDRFGDIQGRGKITMEWLINEFKPLIDPRYHTLTDREHTFIGGSSMGGLMTLYAITRYNGVFSRGAALSPALYFALEENLDMLRRAEMQKDTVLYMDYGEMELKDYGAAEFFRQAVSILHEKGVLLESRIVPGGIHSEVTWEKQVPFFLSALLYEL